MYCIWYVSDTAFFKSYPSNRPAGNSSACDDMTPLIFREWPDRLSPFVIVLFRYMLQSIRRHFVWKCHIHLQEMSNVLGCKLKSHFNPTPHFIGTGEGSSQLYFLKISHGRESSQLCSRAQMVRSSTFQFLEIGDTSCKNLEAVSEKLSLFQHQECIWRIGRFVPPQQFGVEVRVYLYDRTKKVEVNDVQSSEIRIESGVAQGSVFMTFFCFYSTLRKSSVVRWNLSVSAMLKTPS